MASGVMQGVAHMAESDHSYEYSFLVTEILMKLGQNVRGNTRKKNNKVRG